MSLDNEDVGITDVTVAPVSYNPATGAAQLGEGNRFVNVTIKNTGLNPISGSIDVNLEVKEVLAGSDTILYANDFDGNEDSSGCNTCAWAKFSYTGEYDEGDSSWHEEAGSSEEKTVASRPLTSCWKSAFAALNADLKSSSLS